MNPGHNSHKKIIQTTEEALRPIHVPLLLANECYVITQQDVRRIEDSRLLIYSKLMPNGDLRPLDDAARDILAEIVRLRSSSDSSWQNDRYLASLMNALVNSQTPPMPMDIETASGHNQPTVASVQQQLHWDKCLNLSPMKNAGFCCQEPPKAKVVFQNDFQQSDERRANQSSIGSQTCSTYCCCKLCTNPTQGKTFNSIGINTWKTKDTCSQTVAAAGDDSIQN